MFKKGISILVAITCLVGITSAGSYGVADKSQPSTLLVKLKSHEQKEQALNALGSMGGRDVGAAIKSSKISPESPLGRWRIIEFRQGNADKLIEAIKNNPLFEAVEKRVEVEFTAIPNDEDYVEQWSLPKVRAPEAWDISTGDTSVLIGVIDSGIKYDHPDLAGNIWTNPGEIPGNGIDDDGNGYIDDVHGYDFGGDSFGSPDPDPMDAQGHGTHVAGIIAGVGNNQEGISGINWSAKMVAIKIADDSGVADQVSAANGIYYASENGVSVTNNSWLLRLPGTGQPYGSDIVWDAIVDAYQRDIIFVAAAGNFGESTSWEDLCWVSSGGTFPNHPIENIITVAATDQNDNLATFSSYGDCVHLGAPGVDIYSSIPRKKGRDYAINSGTSMAAPHVAGAVALIRAACPTISWEEIRQRIIYFVDRNSGALRDGKTISGGRLDLKGAVGPIYPFYDTEVEVDPYGVFSDSSGGDLVVSIKIEGSNNLLGCDPDMNVDQTLTSCGVGSYGKVRFVQYKDAISASEFLPVPAGSKRTSIAKDDFVDVVFNPASGRYEASFHASSGGVATHTIHMIYLGNSINLPSETVVQVAFQ